MSDPKPRFSQTSCSQCGRDLGPGNSSYSHCSDHRSPAEMGAEALSHALLRLRGPHISRQDDRVVLEACKRLRDELHLHDSRRLVQALGIRCMWENPDSFTQAANEIDCGSDCEACSSTSCRKSEAGDYCPNDVAETLRAIAECARADLIQREADEHRMFGSYPDSFVA